MSVQTTEFGRLIIEEGEKLLFQNIREKTNNNDGDELYQLVSEFDRLQPVGNKKLQKKRQYAYCGMTSSVILDRAFARSGITNVFRSASAGDFIGLASKHKIRRDKKPAPGAVFLTKATGGANGSSSGYHAGIIWYVKDGIVATIEGNTPNGYHYIDGCLVKLPHGWDGIVQKMRPIKSLDQVIHIEEWFDKDLAVEINPVTWNMSGLADEKDICNMEADIDESTEGESSDNMPAPNYLKLAFGLLLIGGTYYAMRKS